MVSIRPGGTTGCLIQATKGCLPNFTVNTQSVVEKGQEDKFLITQSISLAEPLQPFWAGFENSLGRIILMCFPFS